MKRFLFFSVVLFTASMSNAQDVIVKKDGSTIMSKVLEVNVSDVRYKKFSNMTGPTYTINKSDLLSINYENGERDLFNDIGENTQNMSDQANGQSALAKQKNKEEIERYNQYSLKYTSDETGKPAKRAYFTMAYSDGSVIHNDNMTCSVAIGQIQLGRATRGASTKAQFSKGYSRGLKYYYFTNQALQISLTNNTNKTIYVDLANSFYRRGKEASPYYVPTASSSTQSSTMGAGIGIPTAFGVVGIGSSQTHAVTLTTYSERVMAIAPHSTRSLEAEMLFPKDYDGTDGLTVDYTSSRGGYYPIVNIGNAKFDTGEVISFTSENSPVKIGAYITYGYDESFTATEHFTIGLYAREVVGFPYPSGAAAFCANAEKYIEINGSPISFITVIDDGTGNNGIMTLAK